MALPYEPAFPWLLYPYPWMPFPHRVIIYLREKGNSESLIRVATVSDPQDGNHVLDSLSPPKSLGSLPILAIPSKAKSVDGTANEWAYIRQSMAIRHFFEEMCNTGKYGDPVRTFGTAAGTIFFPEGLKEMLRWVRRSLMAVETWWQECGRNMEVLKNGHFGHVTLADIVLYQFLELTRDCYGVDMTIGTQQEVNDVYGRKVVENFPKLMEFYKAFSTRDSATRHAERGEVASDTTLKMMQTWADGVLP